MLLLGVFLFAPREAFPDDAQAVRRLLDDPRPAARAAAVRRLAGAEDRASLGVVLEVLRDEHPYVRRAAAGVLGVVVHRDQRRYVLDRIRRERRPEARAAACDGFVLWADARAREGLLQALDDKDPRVRVAALRALADIAPPSAATDEPGLLVSDEDLVTRVRAALGDRDGEVRAHAVLLLETWREANEVRWEPGGGVWETLGRDRDARVRLAALEGSVARGGALASVAVLRGLGDAVWSVRLRAAELSAQVRTRAVLTALVPKLEDTRRRVVHAAHTGLIALTGVPFDPDVTRWTAWLESDEGKAFDPAFVDGSRGRASPPGDTVEGGRFLGVPLVSDHVVFVVDASKSMAELEPDGRTRWRVVRESLAATLRRMLELGGRRHVNVVWFGTTAEALFPKVRPLTTGLRAEIARRFEARGPAGRTALYDGIALALADPAADQIVVLSDGAPSAGTWFTKTDLVNAVRRDNRFRLARIDVIAVGAEQIGKRWRGVLAEIAEASGGQLVRR